MANKKYHVITTELAQQMLDAGLNPLVALEDRQIIGIPEFKRSEGAVHILKECKAVAQMDAYWVHYLEAVPCESQAT